MFLVNHAAAGALAGVVTGNPIIGFIFGFVSHFPLDTIPHGDRTASREAKHKRKFKFFFTWLTIDIVVTFVLLWIGFTSNTFSRPMVAFWGAIGGILPDILVGIYEYFTTIKQHHHPPLAWFFLIHEYNHFHIITRFDLPFWHGVVYQLAALALFVKYWS